MDEAAKAYPLRLYLHNQNGREPNPKAEAQIPKKKFRWTNSNPDPVDFFLTQTAQSIDFQRTGFYFYNLLHQGAVATEWDAFVQANRRARVLLDIKPPEIASLPWELINDGLEMLTANPKLTFIRYYEPRGAVHKLPAGALPLRVLIVVGAQDNDQAVLPWKEIWRIKSDIYKLNRLAYRLIDIEILLRPNSTELQNSYTNFKPHIFHFIGHGGFNIDGESCLLIDYFDSVLQRTAQIQWTARNIYNDFLGWNWLPGFVFINSCRSDGTGIVSKESKDQAWSIGDVFRKLGIPAVLTMQADINGAAAGVFAGTIYKSLTELEPLDTALGHARRAVKNYFNTYDKRDWAIPVLTVAAVPEEALPLLQKAPNNIMPAVSNAFKEIEFFSDRCEPRRTLIRGFYPLIQDTAGKNLIVVRGKKGVGKSWLAKWSLEVCALLNHDVRYVELGGVNTKTWLDALLQISLGNEREKGPYLIYHPLDQNAFQQFNWGLKHRLLEGRQPPMTDILPTPIVWNGSNYVIGDKKIEAINQVTPEFIDETFNSFCDSLQQAASKDSPLVIVLDDFADLREEDVKDHLIPKLIRQFAGKEKSPVKFILVFSNEEYEKFKNLIGDFQEVTVDFLSPKDFVEVFEEYARYKKPDVPDDTIEAIKTGIKSLMQLENKQECQLAELTRFYP